MLPRHVLDYGDVIRALWLDHSGSMTATDLSRHLAASCPSFYLRPRYTMPKAEASTARAKVARIDREFREILNECVCYTLIYECILVCTYILHPDI